tara:strand:+ start:910 stop:1176 length:267 start_codon:yes stop_codon:yes gene_type:complete
MTSTTKPCSKCKGKGFSYVRDYFDPTEVVPEDCEHCDGTGKESNTISQGDGLFAKRAANGNCVRCDTFLDGALKCKVCHLVYGGGYVE